MAISEIVSTITLLYLLYNLIFRYPVNGLMHTKLLVQTSRHDRREIFKKKGKYSVNP